MTHTKSIRLPSSAAIIKLCSSLETLASHNQASRGGAHTRHEGWKSHSTYVSDLIRWESN